MTLPDPKLPERPLPERPVPDRPVPELGVPQRALPERRGTGAAHVILLTLASLALLPAFAGWTAPASPQDVSSLAANAAFRPSAPMAIRPAGQFTRAMTKNGLPGFWFPDGLPEFWGSCGGTIAINPSSMSPGELNVVRRAAADFAGTASGPWVITTTTATSGSGSVVVVMVDPSIDREAEWGVAHVTTSIGMQPMTRQVFMRISDATIHLASTMNGAQSERLARAVTLHELGHVAGAGHNVSDPRALMAPKMDQSHLGYMAYTAAESAGIRAGGSHGCR
jgi:hypothetical protein